MRIAVPRNYPIMMPRVERAILDIGKILNKNKIEHCLDSFYYDDLQNAIHDQLNKQSPRSIVEILDVWVFFNFK